ncbi:hypothetical protein ACU4GD_10245 [Cupriavidus basilensis]
MVKTSARPFTITYRGRFRASSVPGVRVAAQPIGIRVNEAPSAMLRWDIPTCSANTPASSARPGDPPAARRRHLVAIVLATPSPRFQSTEESAQPIRRDHKGAGLSNGFRHLKAERAARCCPGSTGRGAVYTYPGHPRATGSTASPWRIVPQTSSSEDCEDTCRRWPRSGAGPNALDPADDAHVSE